MTTSTDHRPRPSVLSGSPMRFAATLVIALIATKPAFEDVLADGAPLPGALFRFLVAFAVLWVIGGIAALVLHRDELESDTDVMIEVADMVPGAAGSDR